MAKADGVVTGDEVKAFKMVFKVPEGEVKNVARVFNLAKQDATGYEAYAEQLAVMFKGNRKLLEYVLEGLSTSPRPTGCCIQTKNGFYSDCQAFWHHRDRLQVHQGAPRASDEA